MESKIMELRDFEGIYKLSGVDYMVHQHCIDDGWRSYMSNVEKTDKMVKNVFPDQEVECKYSSNNENILRMFSPNGKLILEIGTDYSDDLYPCAIFHYCPENMEINKNVIL